MSGPAPVLTWVRDTWPDVDWRGATVSRGAFHQVVVGSEAVARVTTGRDHPARAWREQGILRALAPVELPWALPTALGEPVPCGPAPRPVGEPVHVSAGTGALTTVLPGREEPALDWSECADGVLGVLADLAAAGLPSGLVLPPARAWCGGRLWPEIVEGELVPRLPPPARAVAREVVGSVDALESPTGLVHGDLSLFNLRWDGGAVVGLIDLDHACLGDPAMDVAPWVGAFGARRLAGDVDDATLQRAMVHRATLPLQVAAGAWLAGDGPLRDTMLGAFSHRVADGTLHSPDGLAPAS